MRDVFTIADRQLENRVGITRKQKRYIKREVRAQQYAAVARQGGGDRERARRSGETFRAKHGAMP